VRKALISMLVSAAMVVGQMPVMAADTGPLTPGAAAGVQQAQGGDYDNPPIIWIIGGLIVLGIGGYLLTLGSSNQSLAQAVTTGTLPPSQK